MNVYLELDSTYRDRNEYPNPADFAALISQSTANGATAALDPVSNAAPLIVFTPFTALSGTIETYALPLGSAGVVLKIAVAQAASKTANYYAGVVIQFNDGTNNIYHRIYRWTYLQTFGGFDYFEVVFLDSTDVNITAPAGVAFNLVDPSSVSDTAHLVFFVPSSPFAGNYYAGDFLFNQTLNQWITIDSYGWQDHLVLAAPTATDNYVAGTWLLTNTYAIRKAIPVQYGNVIVGITPSTATIVNTLSNYIGLFIRLLSNNEMRRIVAFNSATSVATVTPAFSVVPAGAYEILQFSYDNAAKISYNFSEVSSQNAVCYKVKLLNLIVPNTVLRDAVGGLPIFYPFLYVELHGINAAEGAGRNMIASNNPNSTRMLFRVIVDDSVDQIKSPFIKLDGNDMAQHMKVQPRDSFSFSVHRGDGSLFLSEAVDTVSPMAPNPFVQISAMFQFERQTA